MTQATQHAHKQASDDPIDEIFSFNLNEFPHIGRLKDAVLYARPAVALERSKLLVDYHEKYGFDLERPQLRQAKALDYILSNTKPYIFPEEIIVGSTTEHRLGCVMFPEFQAAVVWPELLKMPHKKKHPIDISQEAIEDFSFRIFPYFKEWNIHEWAKKHYGYTDSIKLMERMVFYLVAQVNGVSHLVPDYPAAIRRGLEAIRDEALEKKNAIVGDDAESRSKRDFYEAVSIVCDATVKYAKIYSDKCRELAASESDPKRKAELVEVADMLLHVPAKPARTLHEALQSLWITHVAVLMENSDLAMSFGRMDQFLLPYYEKDVAEGRIDNRRALELILAFYVKTNDHTPLIPTAAEALFSGSATNQSIAVGGVLPDGRDGANNLSYMFVKALELLKLREPNVDARFHDGSPKEWYRRVLEAIKNTGAAPAMYNDEAIVQSLMSKGATLEDARNYGVIGCVETAVEGKSYPMTGALLLNLASVLELALNNGVYPMSGKQVGPRTGYLLHFNIWDELWDAFVQQVKYIVGNAVEAEKLFDKAHEELHPIPLLSALIGGTMESGKDVTSGGATYNSSGVWTVGLADVVDSLAAIKTLVFEQKRISPSEMHHAVANNFKGYEKIRTMVTSLPPKYGNDDPVADNIAVNVVNLVNTAFDEHKNHRGGPYHVGYWSITFHSGYGKIIGALPNGRLQGTPLASGATPVSGAARKGPSASLSSSAKLPPEGMTNCIALNHKVPASLLNEPGKMEIMEDLVRGYFKKKGMQLQFVVADKEMLLDALDNPEKAKDLLVRVSGYTAYFGDLDRAMQMEIINRDEDVI